MLAILLNCCCCKDRRAGRSKPKHRLIVDGRAFEVNDEEEAEALLEQAITLVPQKAITDAARVAPGKPVVPRVETTAPEIRGVVDKANEVIARIYRDAFVQAQAVLKDDEDAIMAALL